MSTAPDPAQDCPSFLQALHPTEPQFAYLGFPPLPGETPAQRRRAWWKELALRHLWQGTCCPGCRARPGRLHATPSCDYNYSQRPDGRWA